MNDRVHVTTNILRCKNILGKWTYYLTGPHQRDFHKLDIADLSIEELQRVMGDATALLLGKEAENEP